MELTERKPHSLRSVGYFQMLVLHAFSDVIVASGSIAGEGRRGSRGLGIDVSRFASDDNKNTVPGLYPPEQDRE